jgi:anti-anti-sigma factor
MMSTPLNLHTARRADGQLALVAAGEIDLSNVDAFSKALTAAVADGEGSGRTLVVDLSAVEYLDSAAVNALCAKADHIHLIAHPLLISTLTISGLAELVTIEPAPPITGG